MILKMKNKSTRKNLNQRHFYQTKKRKLADNLMTHSSPLFLKPMGIFIFIYSQFVPRRGHSISVRNTNGRMTYMEIISVTFEDVQKHKMHWVANKCILIKVKTRLCTVTVSVCNANCSALKLLSKIKLPVKLSLNS